MASVIEVLAVISVWIGGILVGYELGRRRERRQPAWVIENFTGSGEELLRFVAALEASRRG